MRRIKALSINGYTWLIYPRDDFNLSSNWPAIPTSSISTVIIIITNCCNWIIRMVLEIENLIVAMEQPRVFLAIILSVLSSLSFSVFNKYHRLYTDYIIFHFNIRWKNAAPECQLHLPWDHFFFIFSYSGIPLKRN